MAKERAEKLSDIFGEAINRLVKVDFIEEGNKFSERWFKVTFKGTRKHKGFHVFELNIEKFDQLRREASLTFKEKINSNEYQIWQKYGFLRIEVDTYVQTIWNQYEQWLGQNKPQSNTFRLCQK